MDQPLLKKRKCDDFEVVVEDKKGAKKDVPPINPIKKTQHFVLM